MRVDQIVLAGEQCMCLQGWVRVSCESGCCAVSLKRGSSIVYIINIPYFRVACSIITDDRSQKRHDEGLIQRQAISRRCAAIRMVVAVITTGSESLSRLKFKSCQQAWPKT